MSEHFRKPITPKGPTADTTLHASAGMKAALRAMGARTERPTVEGTPITSRPLPAPTLPPKPQTTPAAQAPAPEAPATPQKPEVDPTLAMGPQVSSYQALLSNDKLAKPTLRAWES